MLIKFYDEVTVFNYELMTVNFGDFPMDDGESLFEYQKNFRKSVVEILKAYQRLVIYLPEESKLLKIAGEITCNAVESGQILNSNFLSIKMTATEEIEAYKAIINNDNTRYHAAVEAANDANQKYWEKMRPQTYSLRTSYQSYLTELNIYLRSSEINA